MTVSSFQRPADPFAAIDAAERSVRLGPPSPVVLEDVERHFVRSRAGDEYRIDIWMPPLPDGETCGTIYLLDAAATFATTVDAIRLQSRRTEVTGVVPTAVVGLASPGAALFDEEQRCRDFTPWPPSDPEHARSSQGGADAFLDFIEQDLIPAVEARFPLDPNRRGLFGHSFGGLFALHTVFTRPGLFAAVAATSPSTWWNASALRAEEERFATAPHGPAPRLLVTVGADEQTTDGSRTDAARLRRAKAMVDDARALGERLSRLGPQRLGVDFVLFAAENHGSVLPASISRALRVLAAAADR